MVVVTAKEENIKNYLDAIRANAVSIIGIVSKSTLGARDNEKLQQLFNDLRNLEKRIYRKCSRDKSFTPEQQLTINRHLAELQAVLRVEKHDLRRTEMRHLSVLAGEEEVIAEEIIREINEGPQWKSLMEQLETGDIVGNTCEETRTDWGKAATVFMLVMESKFCHVGIVSVEQSWFGKRNVYIIESAGGPISKRPFLEWVFMRHRKIAVYRYKSGLTDQQKKTIIKKAKSWLKEWYQFWKRETTYDYALAPGDEQLYCSELVEEAYGAAGIKLSDKYWSVDRFHKNVTEFFRKGVFVQLKIKSADEAFRKVMGPDGFYHDVDLTKTDKFRENIIAPQDILVNNNTRRIFDNIL